MGFFEWLRGRSANQQQNEAADQRLAAAVNLDNLESARSALADGARATLVVRTGNGVEDACPVLFTACRKRNREMVELLLAHGADPNAQYLVRGGFGREWTTCLRAAFPSVAVVRLLLEHGADPNAPSGSHDGVTSETSPLHDAESPVCPAASEVADYQEIANLLRRHGGNRYSTFG